MIVHCLPVNDHIEHDGDTFGTCPCGPKVEAVRTNGQHVGWIIAHHALDDRP